MAQAQDNQASSWLLPAKAFLDDARRLRPGPARDELREVARALREIARLETRLETQSGFAADLDGPESAESGRSRGLLGSTPGRMHDLG